MTMTKEEDPVAAAAEIKRSQSSLELLSNTAAWKNVVENQQSHQQPTQSQNSSPQSARVSPAEQTLKTNSFASSGDFRKDIGMSFDEAAYAHSPNSQAEQPGLPLVMNNSNNSSASLVSSTSSNNLQASLPTFTASWQQQLNPSMHAAFTPPRSNLRASNNHRSTHPLNGGDSSSALLFGGASTRSLHDASAHNHNHHHPPSSLDAAGSRQGSSDDNESSWSFGHHSMDSTAGMTTEPSVHHHHHHHASTSIKRLSEVEGLREENEILKAKLKEKERMIRTLTHQRDELQSRVDELRQLPTGKISQIPIEDMLELMRIYGSELSDTVMPARKTKIQKASVIRQFRRWNPNFLEYFQYSTGKWVPKLGKQGELKRREEARKQRRTAAGGATTCAVPELTASSSSSNNNKASRTAAV